MAATHDRTTPLAELTDTNGGGNEDKTELRVLLAIVVFLSANLQELGYTLRVPREERKRVNKGYERTYFPHHKGSQTHKWKERGETKNNKKRETQPRSR